MAFNIADRVYETSTTQGTGTINLDGSVSGFQSFVDGIGTGNETYYLMDDGTDWEVGIGTVTSGTPDTLSRDTILESSNSDAAVNWGSGTRNVRLSIPAEGFPTLKTDNSFTGQNTFTGKVKFTDQGELTIATGAVTVTGVSHTIDTEADAATDDLETINGGSDGQLLIIRTAADARDVTLKTTGNIAASADIVLSDTKQMVVLQYDAELVKWVVLSGPVNEASETVAGIVERATDAEVAEGVDTERYTTPAQLANSQTVLQTAYAEIVTAAATSSDMPFDDTLPLITEGLELLSVTITPKSTTSKIRARSTGMYATDVTSKFAVVALFRGNTCIRASSTYFNSEGTTQIIDLEVEDTPNTTSPVEYTVRMGRGTTGCTISVNGLSSGGASERRLGGAAAATLSIEEFKA